MKQLINLLMQKFILNLKIYKKRDPLKLEVQHTKSHFFQQNKNRRG